MTYLIQTKNEIREYFNSADFLIQTYGQINKDLIGISHLNIVVPDKGINNPLNNLTVQLSPIFDQLSESGNLSQFIYKVDLNENDFQNALNQSNWDELAFLVIRREAQKVFLKKKFSN